MIVFLFLFNLFSECDVVVEKLRLQSIKEEYLSTTYNYQLTGVFYIDDKDFVSCSIIYNSLYDNWNHEFIRTATIKFNNNIQYTCNTDIVLSNESEFEDFIKTCACQHGWVYYLLEDVFKYTDWTYPSPAWRR